MRNPNNGRGKGSRLGDDDARNDNDEEWAEGEQTYFNLNGATGYVDKKKDGF